MSMEERHDEENRLGALPEQLLRERNEFRHGPRSGMVRGIPADVQRQETLRERIEQTLPQQWEQTAPDIGAGTIPIYETLPANAGNFNFTQETTLTGSVVVSQIVLTEIVPEGRALYVRDMRVNITDALDATSTPATIGIPNDIFTVAAFRNDGSEFNNQGIELEPLDGFNPIFLSAGPLDVFSIKVSYDFSAQVTVPGSVTFLTHVRGDILLINDMPTVYTALQTPAHKQRNKRLVPNLNRRGLNK